MQQALWVIIGVGVMFLIFLSKQTAWWKPVRLVGYGLFKIALGGVFLFIFNSVGVHYDFTIPINPITAAASGLLGLPGLLSLVLIKTFII